MDETSVITIPLPWFKPPVKSNGSRGGNHAHAALIRNVRTAAALAGKNYRKAHGPLPHPCKVTIVWTVTNGIRRDAMNVAWSMKPIIDGFVDAKLWPGDDSKIIPTSSQRIERGPDQRMYLEIEEL